MNFSLTKPIPHLKIQKNLPNISITFTTALIAGLNAGIFGAGGSTGNVISRSRSSSGNSGNVGGGGKTGIVGIVRSTSNHLGNGKSGS
jgi:hypothetical protein